MIRVYVRLNDNNAPPFVIEHVDDNAAVTHRQRTWTFQTLWPTRFVYSARGATVQDGVIHAWVEIDAPSEMTDTEQVHQ